MNFNFLKQLFNNSIKLILKLKIVAGTVATKCIEWLGGVGFTKEFAAEKFYRDCIIGKIYEGTSNINLMTIAKFVKKQYD